MFKLETHTRQSLQAKIDELNDWLENHYPSHYLWRIKTHNRNYYTTKLGEMAHFNLTIIHA